MNYDAPADQQQLQAMLLHLQQQVSVLQAAAAQRPGDALALNDDIKACIPPHLQLTPMDQMQRKQLLRGYPKRASPSPRYALRATPASNKLDLLLLKIQILPTIYILIVPDATI